MKVRADALTFIPLGTKRKEGCFGPTCVTCAVVVGSGYPRLHVGGYLF